MCVYHVCIMYTCGCVYVCIPALYVCVHVCIVYLHVRWCICVVFVVDFSYLVHIGFGVSKRMGNPSLISVFVLNVHILGFCVFLR